ncbi:MAG: TetR/AcrR family transcriptional regulator [Leptospirales bacterium]|nr:TetR/AcrR family transcriptional regulator [Leptospirales bacterium]
MSSITPADRILKRARKLFYEQGYSTTGIDQIIAESGTSKKSFYRYYPSKSDLARAYLKSEREALLGYFEELTTRQQTYSGFVRAWCKILRTRAHNGTFFGCPFGNYASQSPDSVRDRKLLVETMEAWRETLEKFLKRCAPSISRAQLTQTVNRILILYQGGLQMWNITGDETYLKHLEHELLLLQPL